MKTHFALVGLGAISTITLLYAPALALSRQSFSYFPCCWQSKRVQLRPHWLNEITRAQ